MNLSAKSLAAAMLAEANRIGHDLSSVALLIGAEAYAKVLDARGVWKHGELLFPGYNIRGLQVQITGEPRFYRLTVWPPHGDGRVVAEGKVL